MGKMMARGAKILVMEDETPLAMMMAFFRSATHLRNPRSHEAMVTQN